MTKNDIVEILSGRALSDEKLFSAARTVRAATFQDQVVVRGVIEVTNKCRVNCIFCPMRRDNAVDNAKYVLEEETIVAKAREIQEVGINVILIQGGEIPQTTDILERVIPRIVEGVGGRVEILLNLGNKPRAEYARLKQAGALSYILKHETADHDMYQRLKCETLESRLRCMHDLLDLGFKVGTGSIIGLPGQTLQHVADDILLAKHLGVHMVSASPFVPAPKTPLESHQPGSVLLTLRTIAATRLGMPAALIPSVSALEVNEPGGQSAGLQAGANVMTVNFTPTEERRKYLIYGVNRYVVRLQHVKDLLKANGLHMARSRWISAEGSSPSIFGAQGSST